jgi:cell division protein FtsQ
LEVFYKEGLKYAGWTKYDYISLEYVNQVVCHRAPIKHHTEEKPATVAPQQAASSTAATPQQAANPTTTTQQQ